jgi:protein SCO1
MRKSQKIITTVLWSCLVLTMVAVVGLGMWPGQQGGRAAAEPLPVLFDAPHFVLTDQDGQPFDSDQLRGKVWVAAFVFTNCAQACPMMTGKMARLQEAVPSKDVMLVSFTVDPQRDTPDVLKQYAKRFNADPARWRFLTGEQSALLETAAGLKLTAIPARDGKPIDHDEHFLLIDRQGHVRGVYHSNDDEKMKLLARDAEALVEEQV